MSEQLYRHLVDGGVNFDYYMKYAMSPDQDMPHGTIVRYNANGLPVSFFAQVAPFWGMMYDGDMLYRRGAYSGTADQFAGTMLKNRMFVPVKQSDLVDVEECSNGMFDSAEMSGFTTLHPGRYAIVRQNDR